MKKLVLAVATTVLCTLGASFVFGGTIPKVYLNGNKVLLQDSPFIENGSTYIPLRAVAENLGASVAWDAETQTATIQQGITTIEQRINSDTARVNNQIKQLSAPAKIVNGVTYVPVRFITETLGGQMEFDQAANAIKITYDMPKDGGQQYDEFGRLIRATNLPSNASYFANIISGVPNEMYEMPLDWERGTWKITPIEGKHFTKPVNMKEQEWFNHENLTLWKENIEKNLDLRLNVDYQTMGDAWKSELMDTLASRYGQEYFVDGYNKMLNEYIVYMKENHLSIEGDYYVEPSIMYDTGGYYMRTWIKFRIDSDTANEAHLFANTDYPYDYKTNTWYTGYNDVRFGTNNMGSDGSDLTVDDKTLFATELN